MVKQAERRAPAAARRDADFRPERARRDFPGLRDLVFLNAASMGIASADALAAIDAQRRLLAAGPRGQGWARFVERFERGIGEARTEAARLLRADVDEVGLVSDTTAGLHQAVDAIPFRRGDNVVLGDLEYPQVALAAENARRELGVELRFVSHRAGRITVDDYRQAIDRRTRAVLVSSVGWVTGERLDLASLSQLAEEHGFFLVVDAVQQLGGVSLDCSKLRIDFLDLRWIQVAERAVRLRGSLRTSLGACARLAGPARRHPRARGATLGLAVLLCVPRHEAASRASPVASARRFEAQGTPNRLGAAGLGAALRHRNRLGRRGVDRHILDLSGELIDALRARGAQVWTPRERQARAGIVTFTLAGDARADERLRAFLERRSILTTARYSSGIGGVRTAIHLFNTREDVAALLAALDEFAG